MLHKDLGCTAVKAVELYTNFLIYQHSISRVCERFFDALMTFTVVHFFTIVYISIVAVCQPFIKLMID